MHSDPVTNGTVWQGRLTDGRSAATRVVEVRLSTDGILIGTAPQSITWPYADISTSTAVLAHAPDVLVQSKAIPGATLFVENHGFVHALAAAAPQLTQSAFRRAGMRAAGPVGLIAACLAGVVMFFDLSPSKAIARLMPESAREQLGRSVLTSLPVTNTCGYPEGRAALDAMVTRLLPGGKDKQLKVAVLDWDIVNAFAVPGGNVILTRAIIERAATADEIAGVLAHEIGHSMEYHPEAGLVRSVGFWALIQMTFTGTPGAIGNIGSVLMQLAYTRSYEREADQIALKLLREAGISHRPFAGFFKRMQQGRRTPSGEQNRRFSDVLQTHPPTPERIQTIERQPDYPTTPSLTETQWQALKSICGTSRIDTANTDIQPVKPDVDKAAEEAKRRRDANVASAQAQADYAQREMNARRWPEAIAAYSEAIRLEPDSAFYRYNRGRAYQNAGQFEQAMTDYSEALRLNPRYSDATAARGAIHRLRNDPIAARRDLDAALSINPRNGYGLYQRGLLNAADGRFAESEQDFGRVIAGDRSYALAYVRRAEALEKINRRNDAIANYRAALAASPSSPDADTAFRLARERLAALGVPERP